MSKKKELENEGTAYPMDNIPIRVRKVKEAPGDLLSDKEILERLIEKIKKKKAE